MTVNILGTQYSLVTKKYDEEEAFSRRSIAGYCDGYAKEIVVCDMSTYKGWEHETPKTIEEAHKENIRHEIVHAFFNESGLKDCAFAYDSGWANNEEMVDWFAVQGAKIYKAWVEVGAI